MSRISQQELRDIIVSKSEVAAKRRELKRLDGLLASKREAIIQRIAAGEQIREGRLTAITKEGSRANTISYERLTAIVGSEIAGSIKDSMGVTEKTILEITEDNE